MTSAPTVSTGTAGSITKTTAVISGNSIDSTGGANATERGVCYSTVNNPPTTADSKSSESGSFGTGSFNETLSSLTPGTTYFFRAYAINSAGTGYGTASSFTTQDTPTVSLNSPADAGTVSSTTPDLTFTGTDVNSDDIEYQVQIDTVSSFDSGNIVQSTTSTNYLWVTGGTNASASEAGAQSFKLTEDAVVYAVKLKLLKTGSPTDTLKVDIVSSLGGTSLASGTISASSLTTTGTDYVIDLTSGATLIANTTYYIQVTRSPDTLDGTNYCQVNETSSDAYADGTQHYRQNGGVWNPFTTFDLYFTVYAVPLAKFSATPDSTFTDVTNGADTHPFASGDQVKYTIQVGNALTNGNTYYWRVRGLDPSGTNTWGAWSSTRSFTVNVSSAYIRTLGSTGVGGSLAK